MHEIKYSNRRKKLWGYLNIKLASPIKKEKYLLRKQTKQIQN